MAEMTRAPGQPMAARRFHYRDSVYFQDGHWLTAILTAILYLILATALDAAGHVASLAVVIPVTAGAFALGLLMSFSRFRWFLCALAQHVCGVGVDSLFDGANGAGPGNRTVSEQRQH